MKLLRSVQQHCEQSQESKIIDVDEWISRGTLDAIALVGFVFDFNYIAEPHSELVVKYRQAFLSGKSAAHVRALAYVVPIELLFRLPMKRNRDAEACIKAISSATYEVVEKRQAEPEEKQDGQDILAVMLKSPLFKNNT